jgi:DNA repair photolyase
VIWEDARSVISSNDSPDIFFDRSINPYRGCEHVMWLEIPLQLK